MAQEDGTLSLIAGGFAAKFATAGISISCAGNKNHANIPDAITQDSDFTMSPEMLKPEELRDAQFDAVIVCRNNRETVEPFSGNPPIIYWDLPSIAESQDDTAVQLLSTRVKQLVNDFFLNGYCAAFTSTTANYKMLLDNISDAIMIFTALSSTTSI